MTCNHGTPGCLASEPHEHTDCYGDDVARGQEPTVRIADLERKIALLEADRIPFAERYAEVIRRDLTAARAEAEQATQRAWKALDELFDYKRQGAASEQYDKLDEAIRFVRDYLDGEDEHAMLDENRRDNERDRLIGERDAAKKEAADARAALDEAEKDADALFGALKVARSDLARLASGKLAKGGAIGLDTQMILHWRPLIAVA